MDELNTLCTKLYLSWQADQATAAKMLNGAGVQYHELTRAQLDQVLVAMDQVDNAHAGCAPARSAVEADVVAYLERTHTLPDPSKVPAVMQLALHLQHELWTRPAGICLQLSRVCHEPSLDSE